jgi:exonuclease VII large subunit
VKRTLLTVLVATAVLAIQTSAHHSFAAEYLEDQRVTIEGDLVQVDYRSPHSWVHVNAKDVSGVVRQIAAEWGSAARLKQWGVTEQTLKPGDHVIVSGSPSRDPGQYRMHLKSIRRPADGWEWAGAGGRR